MSESVARTRNFLEIRWILMVVLAVALAACSGSAEETQTTVDGEPASEQTTTTTTVNEEPTEEPVVGGVLRVMEVNEPRSLNAILDTNKNSERVGNSILEPFVRTDDDNAVLLRDGLAVDWEVVDDLTWRFQLREGVSFHNGEPFNSDAVVFSILEATQNEESGLASFLRTIVSAEAIDDYTVELKTERPDAATPERLTMLKVVPPAYYGEVGAEQFGLAPIGTGPFVFEEWASGQFIRVVANEDYWGEGPFVEEIVFNFAADASARVSALEANDVDIALNVAPNLIATLNRGVLAQTTSQRQIFAAMNTFQEPFDDVRIRSAVVHAINRENLVALLAGAATANQNIFPAAWASAGGHDYMEFDPDRSRELIAEYEADNGPLRPVSVHWAIGNLLGGDDIPEAVAGMLEQAGFSVVREPKEQGTYFDELFAWQTSDIHVSGSGARFPHEDVLMASRFISDGLARYCHDEPELDVEVNAAAAIFDPELRAETYNELERFFLIERVCWAPLVFTDFVTAHGPEVSGFVPRADELISWGQVSLSE